MLKCTHSCLSCSLSHFCAHSGLILVCPHMFCTQSNPLTLTCVCAHVFLNSPLSYLLLSVCLCFHVLITLISHTGHVCTQSSSLSGSLILTCVCSHAFLTYSNPLTLTQVCTHMFLTLCPSYALPERHTPVTKLLVAGNPASGPLQCPEPHAHMGSTAAGTVWQGGRCSSWAYGKVTRVCLFLLETNKQAVASQSHSHRADGLLPNPELLPQSRCLRLALPHHRTPHEAWPSVNQAMWMLATDQAPLGPPDSMVGSLREHSFSGDTAHPQTPGHCGCVAGRLGEEHAMNPQTPPKREQ